MMELSLCTISFRHQLIALPDIASWAAQAGFQAIELWGVHAFHLSDQLHLDAAWLNEEHGLRVSMLSDYLPMDGDERAALTRMRSLCRLANHWGALKVRTFAGKLASHQLSRTQHQALVGRMRRLCDVAAEHQVSLLVETHPGTYADCTPTALELMGNVDHPACGLNFDVLHLWEAGEDPAESWKVLAPYVKHLHLKNIRQRELLPVFAPHNVYAPAGSREGMVPLFAGACDYRDFFRRLPRDRFYQASLEWFGGFCKSVLKYDCWDVHQQFGDRETQIIKNPMSHNKHIGIPSRAAN